MTPAPRTDKVKILLVDDQPARLLSYESILSSLGQELVRAGSGVEALEQLMKGDFALILLDVSMPGMDGFETAAMIHDHPRFEHTPIIFVTGVHVSELDRLKGYKLGAVDYVSIPLVPDILRSKVAVLVELHVQRHKLKELNQSLAEANARLELANTTLQAEKTRELEAFNLHLSQANRELEDANRALKVENAERVRIEQALKEADRHKDEFLAILAHELRNPLAPIRHAFDMMRRVPLQDEALQWSRDVIGRQVIQLTRLVDDLLDISRITHGTIRLSKEPVAVKSILDRVLEALEPVIVDHQHKLEVDCPDPAISVHGDMTRLVQVLGNLLSNAAKYTPSGGLIQLSILQQDSNVEFRVKDSGVGIEPSSVSKLFNFFTRLPTNSSITESGLGIGLALVRRLVEMHDGTVTVHSAGENQGSEFIVRLPALQVRAEDSAQPALAPDDSATALRRIFVVDDNLDALQSLAMLLGLVGHEVATAESGAQALEVAATFLPELMILDIGMPGMDGYELARCIRKESWGRAMPLIALSGWGQQEDVRRAREAGFDFHLVKPVSLEALSELLEKIPARGRPATAVNA